ncbi:hypothetical protein M9H77_07617 [Catharanthus roseus]|uniref:Uncharacterized protein n=1 Tax=Catharanthus roseus TaxID=4058 RepID=A0ACC0BVP3_CATRO|nr:hypothetical protein M9H77_07617 [Catharanthus roseus]
MYRRTVPRVLGISSKFQLGMVRGSKKKRAHPETSTGPATVSTPPILASIHPETSASPAMMSIHLASASIPPGVSTPPVTLTLFPQFMYLSLAPISTPSSSLSTMGTSLRPASSPLTRPPAPLVQGAVDSRILISSTADRALCLGSCKFWDNPGQNKELVVYRVQARMLSRRSGRRRRRTVYRDMVARGLGKHIGGSRSFIEWELKANVERFNVETGSPIPNDEQLMFEAGGGSNKGHVYGFCSQAAAITVERQGGYNSTLLVPSVSSVADHDACIAREKRLWGYMQQALDKFTGFLTSFASQCGVQLDSIPTLFPPFPSMFDPDIPQPLTAPPSSSGPLLPM